MGCVDFVVWFGYLDGECLWEVKVVIDVIGVLCYVCVLVL